MTELVFVTDKASADQRLQSILMFISFVVFSVGVFQDDSEAVHLLFLRDRTTLQQVDLRSEAQHAHFRFVEVVILVG